MRLVCLTLALAALALPALAAAQSNPFAPIGGGGGLPEPTQTVEIPKHSSSTSDDPNSVDTWQVILILGGAALVLGAIGYVIVGDARRRAPVAERGLRDDLPSTRHRQQKQRNRAKAKAARQQRRRNR